MTWAIKSRMKWITLIFLFVMFPNLGWAGTVYDPSMGEMLYAKNCQACHSTQLHWQARRNASDWSSLRTEVRKWSVVSGLGWSDDEIEEVAQYLNSFYYHFPLP